MYKCIQLYVHAFIKNYTVYGYVNFLEVVEGNYTKFNSKNSACMLGTNWK